MKNTIIGVDLAKEVIQVCVWFPSINGRLLRTIQAKLISAKLLGTVRQNQKTDKNNALTIAQAFISLFEQFCCGQRGPHTLPINEVYHAGNTPVEI